MGIILVAEFLFTIYYLFLIKFFIIILDLSLTIVPLHLLGLKGLIGVTANFLESKFKIGPCADKL